MKYGEKKLNEKLEFTRCNGLILHFPVLSLSGWRCKTNIDECESDPCQYNGTCIDGINSYNCFCIPGITGANCEINIDDCDPNPCGPGRCIDGINE